MRFWPLRLLLAYAAMNSWPLVKADTASVDVQQQSNQAAAAPSAQAKKEQEEKQQQEARAKAAADAKVGPRPYSQGHAMNAWAILSTKESSSIACTASVVLATLLGVQ